MEVMEDGNLMDKVHILIQRDMEYYKEKQKVLQETICLGVIGGHLDFPRYASFAAVKLVLWWEEEYIAAFRHSSNFIHQTNHSTEEDLEPPGGCGGIVKSSDPAKFVALITKSSDQLLEHLHILTQEALDHADLTVLTGTIGATCLLKNCLWCYIHLWPDSKTSLVEQLQKSHKKYHEMGEALAERLLDLHCRLLSLYILQDAESLDWENEKPFCESERGSYVVQMWWLYMQGTKEDLWNTVPPKMAQRVFAGILNESLTILTVRYTHACPSKIRSQLLVVDISNLLLCVIHLLPSICERAEALLGFASASRSKVMRDIHVKCQELLLCFLMRGAPLEIINKVFRKDVNNLAILRCANNGPRPWTIVALRESFKEFPYNVAGMADLNPSTAVILELNVLLSQPEPNWALLLKVLIMRDYNFLKLILDSSINHVNPDITPANRISKQCEAFLCSGDGSCVAIDSSSAFMTPIHYYEIVAAITHVFLVIGNRNELSEIFFESVIKTTNWASCFDRRHVWNQKRPPWFEAIVETIKPLLAPVVQMVVQAVKTGASMYQAMSIVLGCLSQLWDCINPVVPKTATLIQDLLPFDTLPLRHSALLQLLVSALYTELLHVSEGGKTVKFADDAQKRDTSQEPVHKDSVTSFDGTASSTEAIALAVAEALCSIDEDNKHTEQIDVFLEQAAVNLVDEDAYSCKSLEESVEALEIVASDLLMTSYGKRSLKILFHFIQHNREWLHENLVSHNPSPISVPNKIHSSPESLLHTMFHIGNQQFDQLLTGEWKPDWGKLVQIPMGVSAEKVLNQLSLRWEFKDCGSINVHNMNLIGALSKILKDI